MKSYESHVYLYTDLPITVPIRSLLFLVSLGSTAFNSLVMSETWRCAFFNNHLFCHYSVLRPFEDPGYLVLVPSNFIHYEAQSFISLLLLFSMSFFV